METLRRLSNWQRRRLDPTVYRELPFADLKRTEYLAAPIYNCARRIPRAFSLWFLSKFPTQQIREFQNVIRELFCWIREFPGDNRDNRTIFVYLPSAL
jgi:hypothetical protein